MGVVDKEWYWWGTAGYDDEANAIAVDDSGYIYVTGFTKETGTGLDYTTIKYDPDEWWGDWVATYNSSGWYADVAYAIAVDDSGYVYVTGASVGTYNDYATIKYKPDGDTAWVRRYDGPGNGYDEAYAIAVDDSGYVYVTGYSDGNGTSWDYATIKYRPNGDTVWVIRFNGLANSIDRAYAIAVDDSYYVYVTGYATDNETHENYVTIKYLPNGDIAPGYWPKRYDGPGTTTSYLEEYCSCHSSRWFRQRLCHRRELR